MSLITRCPACGTMFRVVPDQLKISEGWVRCGHCSEVFDASAHLSDEAALGLAQPEEPTQPSEMATEPGDLATPPADLPARGADPASMAPGLLSGEDNVAADGATVPAELAGWLEEAERAIERSKRFGAQSQRAVEAPQRAAEAPQRSSGQPQRGSDVPARGAELPLGGPASPPGGSGQPQRGSDAQLRGAQLPQRAAAQAQGGPVPPQRVADARQRAPELPQRPSDLPPLGSRGSDARAAGSDSEPLEPSPLDSPFVFRRSDLGPNDETALPPAPRDSLPPRLAENPAAEELHDVSFVRQARRRAFWRRPLVRVVLSLASLLLAALLVLQLAYHDRDRLALAEPAVRPALEKMCELLQCRLGPPRQIESIVIESSGFNRLRNDTYRLSFSLRNRAPVHVAAPAMELTITDAQDQPIARRVLTAAQLGARDAIPPAAEWSMAVGLVVSTPGSARVAGYRLLAFYP